MPPDLSALQLGLAGAIVLVGTVVQGSLGFGLGTLGVPLLLLIYPGFVPAPMLLVAFVLTVVVCGNAAPSYVRVDGDDRIRRLPLRRTFLGPGPGAACHSPGFCYRCTDHPGPPRSVSGTLT